MDSDDDFEDTFVPQPTENNNPRINITHGQVNSDGKTVRGKDIVWIDYEQFDTAEDYLSSDLRKKLVDEFTLRRKYEWDYADTEMYTCKFSRRAGYIPCPWRIKVSFLSNSDAVLVETCEETSDHIHEVDPDYTPDNSNLFRWPAAATAIVMTGCRNEARPKVILRNLRDANVFDGMTEPTMIQLYNKITNVKNILDKTRDILTTHDLRQKVAEHLETPESDIEAFIPFCLSLIHI